MTDANKRGRSREPKTRDSTPEYPIEGTQLISDIANKKPKRTPQEIMRAHFQKQKKRRHMKPTKKANPTHAP